jgi:hypothetical protein
VLRLGGADTVQNIGQQVYTFKNDVTFPGLGDGRRVLKTGVRLARVNYDVQKYQSGNPLFRFLPEVSFAFPAKRSTARVTRISPTTPRSTGCTCKTTGRSRAAGR